MGREAGGGGTTPSLSFAAVMLAVPWSPRKPFTGARKASLVVPMKGTRFIPPLKVTFSAKVTCSDLAYQNVDLRWISEGDCRLEVVFRLRVFRYSIQALELLERYLLQAFMTLIGTLWPN